MTQGKKGVEKQLRQFLGEYVEEIIKVNNNLSKSKKDSFLYNFSKGGLMVYEQVIKDLAYILEPHHKGKIRINTKGEIEEV